MPRPIPFTEEQARDAIARARCWTEALGNLGYRNKGGNAQTIKKYAARWEISTDHFDPGAVIREALARGRRNRQIRPLDDVLVKDSSYPRGLLKRRLYAEGLKARACEMCGQGEDWNRARMSLILDHINGDGTDNRIENLQIVCPNCAGTLATHCGRNLPRERRCVGCGEAFEPHSLQHRYCTHDCFTGSRSAGAGKPSAVTMFGHPQPHRRKVDRPPYDQLMHEIEETNFCAVGRKYGVSDNAVRKWVRFYEREMERERQVGRDAEAA